MRKKVFAICATATLFLLPLAVLAQTQSLPISNQKVLSTKFSTLRTSPEFPGPNTKIKVRIEAYGVDIGNAKIIWSIDGVPTYEGNGLTEISFTTKNLGEKTVVTVTAFTTVGRRLDDEITIEPAEVDLLWEAKTYVPPFYKGKALPTYASDVRVTAMPRLGSVTADPNEYSYVWTINRTGKIGEGLGRSSAVIKAMRPNQKITVGAQVSKLHSSAKGAAYLDIRTSSPLVRFYEDAPLLGLKTEKALGKSTEIKATDATIRSVPYYFSIDDYRDNRLLFRWTNNAQGANPQTSDKVVLTKETSGSVGLRIRNTNRVLQDASYNGIISIVE